MDDEELQGLITDRYYYREDGRLCWKETSPYRKAGQVAGWQSHGHKYRTVRAKGGVNLSEHRAIFLLHFGWLPEIVDHINGDPLDNRIENLRESDAQKNALNRKTQRNNTSGQRGVHFEKRSGRWISTIQVGGKKVTLGYFTDLEEAIEARQKAERLYHGELRRI